MEKREARSARLEPGPTAPGQIALIFGSTGHHDLRPQDIETLENAVRSIFDEFRSRYPATPLSLLSSLAEGADRLVARVALGCGLRLIVPLPMPRALYEKDFETAESRSEFEELLRCADEWFEMPLVGSSTEESLEVGAPGREWQYAQADAYIARQCQILLALRDGQPAENIAGTAESVRLLATGASVHAPEALVPGTRTGHLDLVEIRPIFHLITPRAGSTRPPPDAFALYREFQPREEEAETGETAAYRRKNTQAEMAYGRIYANLDSYNRSALSVEHLPWLTARCRQSAGYLMPDTEADGLPADLRALRVRYAVADTLAQRFQQDTENILIALSLLVFLAASLFETYEAGHDPRFLLGYPLFLGVVYIGWSLSVKRGRWQDKYQDYRALAEGLRVAFFWRLIGQMVPITDHYLHKQRSDLDWIRIAIQNASGDRQLPLVEKLPGELLRERLEMTLKHWVVEQSKYFTRSAVPKNKKKLENAERGVKWLLLASQIIPAGLALLLLHEFPASVRELADPPRQWLEQGLHEHAVVALSALMAVAAGLLHTYADKKAFAQHVKQYKRMDYLFIRAERRLREYLAHEKEYQAAELILELGRESLEENGDWVLTHRERPVDVPHVG